MGVLAEPQVVKAVADGGSAQRLYARLWRWHFFAALIVIPFALWQSVTGVLYLWHREIADAAYPGLVSVAPGEFSTSYQQQLATVLTQHPRQRLQSIEVSDDPTRSTAFFFTDPNGLPSPAFTNPHTGAYLGHVPALQWVRGLSRGLHGGWPINPWGSYLLELGAGWAIVMILTGMYLWWPRNARGLAGVFYPRLRNGSRVFWRDLHATVGAYFAIVLLAFLFSALPWTSFWGEKILAPIEAATHQGSPRAFFFAGAGHRTHAADHAVAAGRAQPLTLDEVIARARAAGARGAIELQPSLDGSLVNLHDEHPRTSDELWMQLDGRTGAVLIRATWDEHPLLAKMVASGVDLHEGRFLGRINQVFNTAVAGGLVWLCITGFIGWYRRRPSGGMAAPPKRALRFPAALLATGIGLCLVLPLLGLSVGAIEALDRIFGRLLSRSA